MSIFTLILASLVALEFFYIMYLETIATTSATTARVFSMSQEELEQKSVNTLFKNQGVYNGLLGILVLIAAFVQPNPVWLGIFMVYIILVAAYGAVTSDPKILFKQGGLAMLTLLSLFFEKGVWDKSPSLSIVFGLSSKTQWLSGLYYADFISFYSPTQLCGGGTTKSNSNELPISVPLSFFI